MAVTSSAACDLPSSLFAWQGVLGCHRPIAEVALRVVQAALLSMAALGVIDMLFARHTKGRYFFLHACANLWITLLCLPDVYWILTDPLGALASNQAIHWPTSIVFSVHVYHVLFFKNLTYIDWLHHIVMVAVGAPLLITGEVGPLINFNNAIMCGVPGGIDYVMLFFVKEGWMEPIQEKRYNSVLNIWMRAPLLVSTGTLVFVQGFVQTQHVPAYVRATRYFLMFLACWNALFFAERVVGNLHVNEYKRKLERKAAKAAQLGARKDTDGVDSEENPYETAEHVSAGLFPRSILSRKDLAQLEKDAAKAHGE